jgi:hypothetical protein
MTPTEKITSIHAIKTQKSSSSELSEKINSQSNTLRKMVFSQSNVWNEIHEWMTKSPTVNENEIEEFRKEKQKNGK